MADLADSLRLISDNSQTGVLRMSAAGHFRMAFFEDGALVYLVSDVPEENLAAFFARAGRVESAADRLTLFQIENEVSRKQTLVQIVLERNLRDAETLREWLVEYAFEVFARAFDGREPAVKLNAGIRAPHPLPYRVPALELILEAVHRMRDDGTIHEVVGPLSRYTRPSSSYAQKLQDLPLSFFDGIVATQVSGQIALQDLLTVSGIAEADALRSIVALRFTEIIEPFFDARTLSDSARLRMRQAAAESGYAMDSATAVAALGFVAASSDDSIRDGAVTMGEFDGSVPYMPQVQRGHSAPLVYPPPRPRGDTGRLRLLASAYVQMAETEAAAGNYVAAVQCFESALSQKPDDLDTLVAYAAVIAKRPGGLSTAENVLNQATEKHPKSVAPLLALARLYKQSGRLDEAEDMLLEAKRLEPGNARIRTMLEDLNKGGGLLAKLGFRSEPKPAPPEKPIRTPSNSHPPVRRMHLPLPAMGGVEEGRNLRCRHCGRMVKGELRVCLNCGATL